MSRWKGDFGGVEIPISISRMDIQLLPAIFGWKNLGRLNLLVSDAGVPHQDDDDNMTQL